MGLALAVGLCFSDPSAIPLLFSMIITMGVGSLLVLFNKLPAGDSPLDKQEAMAAVALCWLAAGLAGALPFYLGGVTSSFTDAAFESFSGITTTGASVLNDIESVPRGFLFWRSFIQWLGGMGIIVLSLAILPLLGVGGMELYNAEVPNPLPDKLQPRIRETAKTLWKVYILFSLCEVLLLKTGGLSLFDSLCHALTSMPTGGFSTRNLSVAAYDSAYVDLVIILFMVLAGINFTLHYQMLRGKPLAFWRDAECRFFLFLLAALIFVVSWDLYGPVYETIGSALRYGAFQVVSIITTTGYATADYETWPSLSRLILFVCMFIGASAGSTGGGMKCVRIMLGIKYCYRELFALIHPKAVAYVKLSGKTIPEDAMKSIMGFLFLYILIFIICSLVMAAMGIDPLTAVAAVASSLGNIGPGFGGVGPLDNFYAVPVAGKWLLIWCMLLGRLEIYTILILLVPEFWKK